jgi:hypothetical protein
MNTHFSNFIRRQDVLLIVWSQYRYQETCFPKYIFYLVPIRSRGSSVSIVSGYGLDDRAIGVQSSVEAKIFPVASVSRPALGPTQPPVQWGSGSFPRG